MPQTPKRRSFFTPFARATSRASGHPIAFMSALALIVVWGALGPVFHYTDTWQLVINTGTTIITFLMVFLIQNTQNRDSEAMHLKLDELIRATGQAEDSLMNLEELEDDELKEIHQKYCKMAEAAKSALDTPGRGNREATETPK
ncbi:low affinity iron permease family protein [soil metagenome]